MENNRMEVESDGKWHQREGSMKQHANELDWLPDDATPDQLAAEVCTNQPHAP
jgi:hypothetical protein